MQVWVVELNLLRPTPGKEVRGHALIGKDMSRACRSETYVCMMKCMELIECTVQYRYATMRHSTGACTATAVMIRATVILYDMYSIDRQVCMECLECVDFLSERAEMRLLPEAMLLRRAFVVQHLSCCVSQNGIPQTL